MKNFHEKENKNNCWIISDNTKGMLTPAALANALNIKQNISLLFQHLTKTVSNSCKYSWLAINSWQEAKLVKTWVFSIYNYYMWKKNGWDINWN